MNATRRVCVAAVLLCTAAARAEGSSRTNVLGIEFVVFPTAEFRMGCPPSPPPPWKSGEELQEHVVRLSGFAISCYPIRATEFCLFLNELESTESSNRVSSMLSKWMLKDIHQSGGKWRTKPGREQFAVQGVAPKVAESFCDWFARKASVRCRLPTEAEWEFAARGSEGRTYPWGEIIHARDPLGSPVGANLELATPDGVHDLNGPVLQWCLDVFDPEFYLRSPAQDPICLTGRDRRVLRGGPMVRYGPGEKRVLPAAWLRFATDAPSDYSLPIGFRIVVVRQR